MSALFSSGNQFDVASLITDSAASNLPVANLADRKVQKVWRALATTAYFGADFGSLNPIRELGLFGCTLASTDTIRHRLSATAMGNGELLDTTAVACDVQDGYWQHLHILAAAVSARYWRCDIVATSRAAEGYFDIGRAWAGDVWEPAINFSLDWHEQWVDSSIVEKSPRSGAVFVDEGVIYRRMGVQFDAFAEADRVEALYLDRVAGKRSQILFVPNSAGDPETEAILGRMIDTTPVRNPTDSWPARYSKQYDIEQDL